MARPIIEAQHLSKLYRLGMIGSTTLRESIERFWSKARGKSEDRGSHSAIPEKRRGPQPGTFWALRDVSFSLQEGEILGIIGRNGAGKSTLLKVLSRITEPTSGQAVLRGRVASILEVGTGFHPELSGRDNIFLNGAMLGMKRAEIRSKLDEIVAFAEVGDFVDTPVKRYSSGMYVRLAFAVAAHLEPEILIVDEVLAVGDLAFQKKCLRKMDEVAKHRRTVLFVSHNLFAVQSLCNRAIWIHDGAIRSEGSSIQVVSQYIADAASVASDRVWSDSDPTAEGGNLRLRRLVARRDDGVAGEILDVTTPLRVDVDYEVLQQPCASVSVGVRLFNEQDVLVFDIVPPLEQTRASGNLEPGFFRTSLHLPGNLLNNGIYRIMVLLIANNQPVVEIPDALLFHVEDCEAEREGWYGQWPGVLRPTFRWDTNLPLEFEPAK